MSAVVISQPMLFPWPGFFEQMMLADNYLWLDDAQFSKGSLTNRIQIRQGDRIDWLTVPLASKGSFQLIKELAPAKPGWKAVHLAKLEQVFRTAPYRLDALSLAERVYAHDDLCSLLIASAELPASYLGIASNQRRARTGDLARPGASWRRVLDLVLAVGGDRYITGHGAARYLDHEAFEAKGVAVEYMGYSKTPWPQDGATFTPFVSILDLIAHTGPSAREYLRPSTIPWRIFLERQALRR